MKVEEATEKVQGSTCGSRDCDKEGNKRCLSRKFQAGTSESVLASEVALAAAGCVPAGQGGLATLCAVTVTSPQFLHLSPGKLGLLVSEMCLCLFKGEIK